MTNILLSGAGGKMGAMISRIAQEGDQYRIAAGIDINAKSMHTSYPVFASLDEFSGEVDAIIDFSHYTALDGLLAFALREKLPLVVATTGHTAEQLQAMREASRHIPVFYSRNMSIGINMLMELVRKAAAALPGFDIEIIEKHHNRKLDAPSGTALMLAEAAAESVEYDAAFIYERQSRHQKRDPHEIGIHAVRGGTVVGEHDVLFCGPDEVITLSHSAASREVFAQGALRAAAFIANRPAALYNMTDLVNASDFD